MPIHIGIEANTNAFLIASAYTLKPNRSIPPFEASFITAAVSSSIKKSDVYILRGNVRSEQMK